MTAFATAAIVFGAMLFTISFVHGLAQSWRVSRDEDTARARALAHAAEYKRRALDALSPELRLYWLDRAAWYERRAREAASE